MRVQLIEYFDTSGAFAVLGKQVAAEKETTDQATEDDYIDQAVDQTADQAQEATGHE